MTVVNKQFSGIWMILRENAITTSKMNFFITNIAHLNMCGNDDAG